MFMRRSRGASALQPESPARLISTGSVIVLLSVGSAFWLIQALVLENFIAQVGSSALHWLYVSMNPSLADIDWPTGTRNLGKSLSIQIYSLLDSAFGIDAGDTIYVYTFLEVQAFLFACAFYFRIAERRQGEILMLVFAVVVALTSLQYMNLARFIYPFHLGLYYSFAGAARILAIACILCDRRWHASAALSVSVMIHPLIGGVGVIVGSAIIVTRGLSSVRRYLLPGLIGGGVAALWILYSFSETTPSSGEIPLRYWLAFTEKFNVHWYPLELGVLVPGIESYRRLLPLLSMVVLYLVLDLSDRQKASDPVRRDVRVAVLTLVVLTIAGVLIGALQITPVLIKLALHRSGDLLAIVAFGALLPRLFDFLDGKHGAGSVLASTLILLSVFYHHEYPGFPLVFTLILTFPMLKASLIGTNVSNRYYIVVVWTIGFACFLCYMLVPLFESTAGVLRYFVSLYLTEKYLSLLLCAFVILALYQKKFIARNSFHACVLTLVVSYTLYNHVERMGQFDSSRTDALREAQIWARENTAADALFMLDPGSIDAWRDYSRRASFGNVNEWLHKAWLYDSSAELFHEGTRRFSLLGLNHENYLNKNRYEVYADVSRQYYTADLEWFVDMKESEDISYFLIEKGLMENDCPSDWIVYENSIFMIVVPVSI